MQVHENFLIADRLYYKIGGIVRYFLEVKSREDILQAIDFLEHHPVKHIFILGLGSNLIFTDEFFDGAVMQIGSDQTAETFDSPSLDMIHVWAGNTLDSLVTQSFELGLVGMEWAGGLPGTVGAAVRGNVGAFGRELKDVFLEAEVLEIRDENKFTISRKDYFAMDFHYRDSLVKHRKKMIIMSATVVLTPETIEAVEKAKTIAEENRAYRTSHHPLEYPNCGSVFKNIARKDEVQKVLDVWPDIASDVAERWHGKVSMGYLIKRFGLSGHRIGNAQVSEKHGNFIVNLGGAKANDVKQIIHEIENKSFQTFGFVPEVEVEIVT